MAKWFAVLLVGLSVGCTTAPDARVVSNVEILRENTHALASRYEELLERSSPLEDMNQQQWAQFVSHEKLLMRANNTLADKVHEWTQVASGLREDGGEPK